MNMTFQLVESGVVPDNVIRPGITELIREHLARFRKKNVEEQMYLEQLIVEDMKRSPISLSTEESNRYRNELPPEFFSLVMGKYLKFSCCHFPSGKETLDEAGELMLDLTCQRAELEDGMEVLDLGCGWGALTLWIAEQYPRCRVLAVSHSSLHCSYIESQCLERGLQNVEVVNSEITDFVPSRTFDRVLAIEMFEHLRNYRRCFPGSPIGSRRRGGFLSISSAIRSSLPFFEASHEDDWMGRYFFTGGLMPSEHLLHFFQEDLTLEKQWRVSGLHYKKTAEQWLQRLDDHHEIILPMMEKNYGRGNSVLWFRRWRIFFMACSELWGHQKGQEWWVAQYLFKK